MGSTRMPLWSIISVILEKENDQLQMSDDLVSLLKRSKSKEKCEHLIKSDEFWKLHMKFKEVREEYFNGNRGKTAQFWMIYLDLVELQQKFYYSIKVVKLGGSLPPREQILPPSWVTFQTFQSDDVTFDWWHHSKSDWLGFLRSMVLRSIGIFGLRFLD